MNKSCHFKVSETRTYIFVRSLSPTVDFLIDLSESRGIFPLGFKVDNSLLKELQECWGAEIYCPIVIWIAPVPG